MKMGNIEVYGIIYRITNKINKKVYIGQTTLTFKERYHGGKWWKETHNTHLKNSVKKYGLDNFEVIEIFDIAFSKSELDIKEIVYIELYNACNKLYGYNNRTGGSHGKHSDESKLKMSKVHKGVKLSEQTRQNMSKIRKGKRLGNDNPMYNKNPLEYMSEESYKDLMRRKSENMKGDKNPMFQAYGEKNPFFGRTHSDETKEKIRQAHIGKNTGKDNPLSIMVEVYNNDNDLIKRFDSIAECCKWMVEICKCNSIYTAKSGIQKSIKTNKNYKDLYFRKTS